MKHYYTAIFFAVLSCASTAQNYQLFNADSKKAFTTYPVAGSTFHLGFEDVQVNGDNSTYHVYKSTEEFEIEMGESCMTLSSNGYCFPETKSGWMGANVTLNNANQTYTFQTNSGTAISLNLNQAMGQGFVFYQDSIQKFYFNRLFDSYEDISGVMDSVRNLEIIHTDLDGNIINSALNSFIVKSGKTMGMVNFFAIDSFPQLLRPVTLIGNSFPVAGLTQITNDDLYTFEPGDELQYNEKRMNFTCHAEVLYDRFVKLSYLERTDTSDSIIFVCRREMFQRDSLKLEVDTISLSYKRNLIVASLPFDYTAHDQALFRKNLYMGDYCGEQLWSFTKTYTHMSYCEETDCWSWQDLPKLPLEESETVVMGIGRYTYHHADIIETETQVYDFQVNYFRKGTIECGNELIVATEDIKLPTNDFSISPNPATESVILNGIDNGTVSIISLEGKVIRQVNGYESGQKLQLNDLNKGIYIVSVQTTKGILTSKLVLQ